MIRSLWISKTGLDAQQTQMDVTANNLANVSTHGFKRSRAVFEDLLYQTLRQPGAQSSAQTQLPSGLQLGTGVRPWSTERIFPLASPAKRPPAGRRDPGATAFSGAEMPDGTRLTRATALSRSTAMPALHGVGFPSRPHHHTPQPRFTINISAMRGRLPAPGTTGPRRSATAVETGFINPAGLPSVARTLNRHRRHRAARATFRARWHGPALQG